MQHGLLHNVAFG